MSIQVDVISTDTDLYNLEPEWTALFFRNTLLTPFQSAQWMISWWKWFGGSTLKVVTIRNNGDLIGVAPFFIYLNENRIRKLCFIGSGISDYLGLIYDPLFKDEVMINASKYLDDINNDWDECDLQELHSLDEFEIDSLINKYDVKMEQMSICPFLYLTENANNLRKIVPKKLRKNVGHFIRELKSAGDFTITTASIDTIDSHLNTLYKLHGARWTSRDQSGVLYEKNLQLFHFDAASSLFKNNLLQLYQFCLNGKPIASYYVMQHGKKAYFYIGGFDPAMKEYSPGTVSLYLSIEDTIAKGAEIFDFLRGAEPYKYLWGAVDSFNYRLHISHKDTLC